MGNIKIRKNTTEKKLIWNKVKHYIDFLILTCCLVVIFNIHPSKNIIDDSTTNESKMLYIFHDYEGNQYILNDTTHGSASSRDYLFDDEVPSLVKAGDATDSVSLANIDWNSKTTEWIIVNDKSWSKNNQVSFDEIMSDLWLDNQQDDHTWEWKDTLLINLSDVDLEAEQNDEYYVIKEESLDNNDSVLVIQKDNMEEDGLLTARTFTFTSEWRVIPILLPWSELYLNNSSQKSISYVDNYWFNTSNNNSEGVSIVEDYESCTTPWWYKIVHWDSVLAYQQTSNDSGICNIERRFCRRWKLSGTYTQQGCYTKETFSHMERWADDIVKDVTQEDLNSLYDWEKNWAKSTTKPLWTWSFVFDQPSQASTPEFYLSDNIRPEDEEVEQTRRPHWDCTTPWWEKVSHGSFIQAFKHANWFNDAPCEAQIRLCTMWNLMWTYTESTCKTWDSSFIDWINGSPTRDTYSKEKLEWIKKQIKAEKNYKKDYWRQISSEELNSILNILDK